MSIAILPTSTPDIMSQYNKIGDITFKVTGFFFGSICLIKQ